MQYHADKMKMLKLNAYCVTLVIRFGLVLCSLFIGRRGCHATKGVDDTVIKI